MPEALIGVPETWSPDQIGQLQAYWDALLEGDYDEWLAGYFFCPNCSLFVLDNAPEKFDIRAVPELRPHRHPDHRVSGGMGQVPAPLRAVRTVSFPQPSALSGRRVF